MGGALADHSQIVPETNKQRQLKILRHNGDIQDKIPKSNSCVSSHITVSQKQIAVLSYSFQYLHGKYGSIL